MERVLQKSASRVLLGALFALLVAFATMQTTTAYADEALDAEIDQLQAQIESSAQDYEQAKAKAEELHQAMAENQARIDEINEQLPAQIDRSAESARTLYSLHQEGFGLLEMIISSSNLNDFLKTVDYVDVLTQHNTSQIIKLNDLNTELQETQEQMEKDAKDAEEAADRAERAMEQAKASRQAAQERAIAEAAQQLANQQAVAAQVAAEANEQANDSKKSDSGNSEAAQPAGTNAQNPESAAVTAEPAPEAQGTVSAEDVSWQSDRDAFIGQWAGRIDAYLGGSPLSGQGATFAAAAWDYGVDPRWSPAISCVESSKGAACFLPHNAWGWGSSSWGSWEEAIYAHVGGLARGYGSTITYGAAAKYCPPNANSWYNLCLAEMNKI